MSTNTWQHLDSALKQIAKLERDWDGYGAAPPSPKALDKMLNLLTLLERVDARVPDRLVPAPDGCLVLAWQNQEIQLEVEVAPEGLISLMYVHPEGTFEHADL